MSDQIEKSDVEKLKDLIIQQVAQDILIVSESVDNLINQVAETQQMVNLLNENVERNFDLAAKNITEYLAEQEKHLSQQADDRTKQVTLNIADNVEKILNAQFTSYNDAVSDALAKFEAVNKSAVGALLKDYKETKEKITTLGEKKKRKGWFSRK